MANGQRSIKGDHEERELVVTGTSAYSIEEGDFVFVTVAGYALSASQNGPTGARFAGVALEAGTGGSTITVLSKGTVKVSGSFHVRDMEKPAFVQTNKLAALSGANSAGLHQVGTVHEVVSNGVWIRIGDRNLGDANLTP